MFSENHRIPMHLLLFRSGSRIEVPANTLFPSRNLPAILLFRAGNGLCNSCGWLFRSFRRLRRSLSLSGLLRSLGVRRFMIHKFCFVTIAGGDLGLPVGKMCSALGVCLLYTS